MTELAAAMRLAEHMGMASGIWGNATVRRSPAVLPGMTKYCLVNCLNLHEHLCQGESSSLGLVIDVFVLLFVVCHVDSPRR